MVFSTVGRLALLASILSTTQASPLPTTHELTYGKHGAVASEVATCSQIGIDLQKIHGGNAADALVGTVLCVGTIGMYHSGIGGGGFMLVRTPKGKYEFIDFRETAPAAAFEEMYANNTIASITGGLASGVPGELRGLEELHTRYGSLPWKDLVTPSVKLARNGFRVSEDLVRYMAAATTTTNNFLVNDPSWAIDFAPHGTRVQLGETMYRKRYADTLEKIGEHGVTAFYQGHIAETMIKALTKANGTMTLQDLKDYKVAIRKPASINYRGYKLHSCSAPSGGTVVLSTLKVVEGYDMGSADIKLATHRLDESMRFAYGARSELGDPSFLPNMTVYQAKMLNNQHAKEVRRRISDLHTQNVAAYDPKGLESLETPGTSHVVTADAQGMAISLTTTVNLLFGSLLMVPETGIIMNNEMNDFSIPGASNAFGYIPSPANYVKPGKRPLSSIAPTIVENADGSLYFVTGAAGGSRIITSTIQNLWQVLDRKKNAYEGIASPRLHDQLVPNIVSFEYNYDNATTAYMASLGHNVTFVAPGQSSAQQIRITPNGTFESAGEPRQKNSGGFAF